MAKPKKKESQLAKSGIQYIIDFTKSGDEIFSSSSQV
jgi:hypothetical protein